MAYQVRRQAVVSEDLELVGLDNAVAKTIHVEFNAEAMLERYRKCENDVIRAQLALKKQQQNLAAFSDYGNAIVKLFECIFGEEEAAEILEFYSGRYVEMAQEVMPFITDVIQPVVKQSVDAKKAKLADAYSFSRAQRRKLGL